MNEAKIKSLRSKIGVVDKQIEQIKLNLSDAKKSREELQQEMFLEIDDTQPALPMPDPDSDPVDWHGKPVTFIGLTKGLAAILEVVGITTTDQLDKAINDGSLENMVEPKHAKKITDAWNRYFGL